MVFKLVGRLLACFLGVVAGLPSHGDDPLDLMSK